MNRQMMWLLFFYVALQAQPSTPGNNCHFTYNGKYYDLSQLKIPIETTDGKVSMAICGDWADRGTGIMCDPAMINQFLAATKDTGCNSYLAKWDPSVTAAALSTGGSDDGFSLKFDNGAYCDIVQKNREVTIDFACADTDEANMKLSEPTTCVYEILYKTTHACATTPRPSGGKTKSGGLSGGWIFIIILLCLTFVYCVGGMAYNYKYDDSKEGMDLIPQRTMWTGIMEYTIVGCNVSWTFVRSKYHEMCSKDRSYSVDDSEGPYTGRKFSSAGA